MRVAFLTTDSREHYRDYSKAPFFAIAPQALLSGFEQIPQLEIHIISCLQEPVPSRVQLASNIFYHGLRVPKTGWLRSGYFGCIRAVRGRLSEIKPHLVHAQGTERDCAMEGVFSGYPNVITIHGNMAELARLFKAPFGSYSWFAARLEGFALKRSAGVLCNSKYTRRLVEPRAKRVWEVPNPIREEFLDNPPNSPPPSKCILVNVGVISERKRQLELLQAAKRLYQLNHRFELNFIGYADRASPYVVSFFKELKEAEQNGYARYLGMQSTSEMIQTFDRASGMIHFPMEEAFGLVVVEGLARNLKVFGSRTGGLIDIARGESEAELVGVDDWDGLVEKLDQWMKQNHPRARAANALMRERYLPLKIAQRHLEIYEDVLRTRR